MQVLSQLQILDLQWVLVILTDKRYATHLNSTNSLDAAADRVDEPGRSFWGSLIYDF